MWRYGLAVVVAGAVVPFLIGIFVPSSPLREIAHESTRIHLNLFGAGIYEYHARTGQWPTQIDDLAKTPLPLKSLHWKTLLDNYVDVIVWHKHLKPDPQDNADQILVYHNKGLISAGGQSWVCWGDLRTEYIKTDDLRAYLQKLKE